MECELFGCVYNNDGYCNYNNAEIKDGISLIFWNESVQQIWILI